MNDSKPTTVQVTDINGGRYKIPDATGFRMNHHADLLVYDGRGRTIGLFKNGTWLNTRLLSD